MTRAKDTDLLTVIPTQTDGETFVYNFFLFNLAGNIAHSGDTVICYTWSIISPGAHFSALYGLSTIKLIGAI